jgi:selenocysteine-specific elongation factor
VSSESSKFHLIAGTAGHIDHGKTALVKALTGVDTDRLEEEKRRGISIDLGFAQLDLTPEVRIGFVDVPGHERFVKNMLAGATGIDLAVLVVAANEGIQPQTREHFDICRLLGVRQGVVALTKSDLVNPEMLEMAGIEVQEFVRGSFLESAPVVAVSSVTGLGLDALRSALAQAAETVRAQGSAKNRGGYARLPIDRSFSIRGHGTVVTGTLISGSISAGDTLELYPTGRTVRVRGAQVHGSRVERASAGERTAVNIAGVDTEDAGRGMMLAPVGVFRPARYVDADFELLAGAHPLKHRAPVHFHAGTAAVEAEARLIESLTPMRPGSRALVRFLLREPLQILPGDRFIARMFSPVATIGGGVIVETGTSPPRVRRSTLALRLNRLKSGSPAECVAQLVGESGSGLLLTDLVARTGMRAEELREITATPEFFVHGDWIASRTWAEAAVQSIRDRVGAFHRQQPLRPGIPKEQLRTEPAFLLDALLARASDLIAEGDSIRLSTHGAALSDDARRDASHLETLYRNAGLVPAALPEMLQQSGLEAKRARTLIEVLLRSGALVRISADLLYHRDAIERLRAVVMKRKGARFTVAEFKEWTGVSRKFAIPLLEFLDRTRVTRREGDLRVVL